MELNLKETNKESTLKDNLQRKPIVVKRQRLNDFIPYSKNVNVLRQLLRQAFFEAPSGLNSHEIASRMGISYFRITGGLNKHRDFKFSASRILPLMQASGDVKILKYFARNTGYAIYPIPRKITIRKFLDVAFMFWEAYGMTGRNIFSFLKAQEKDRRGKAELLNVVLDYLIELLAEMKAMLKKGKW